MNDNSKAAIKSGKIEGTGINKNPSINTSTNNNNKPHVIEMKKKKKDKEDCIIF